MILNTWNHFQKIAVRVTSLKYKNKLNKQIYFNYSLLTNVILLNTVIIYIIQLDPRQLDS